MGVTLIVAVICLMNRLFGFNLFGHYGKIAEILSFVILAIIIGYVGPTMQEIRNYRAQRRRG